ncbi:hypothetical protein ACE1B6_06385 [Aerosakkonemataceae cyanobacterium BLCC-F154]|uniref:Glycosyltransferase RgtA/B/C/D-like domain-containing protein n=1 Tax=Floridaenema fluviatile BLCC-F154 TaxID=3153640 RepID=A0ABV4Y9H4_9CYAN
MLNLQFIKQNAKKVLTYGVLMAISLLLLRLIIFNFQMIFYPFQLEYREAAPLTNTILLLKGGNPYDIANQPENTNVYGILYPLFVYPFAKLWGATIPVHRAISTFFIFAATGLIFWVMRSLKVSLILSIVAAIVFYWHQILSATFFVKPDSMGLFLFLASLVVAWKHKYSWLSLLASIILGLLGFIAKPYFVLSIPYLCLYLFLFHSKKKGIYYGFLSFLATGFTFGILNGLFATYFDNNFFGYLNQRLAGSGLNYAFYQSKTYIFENLSIVVILVAFGYILVKNTILNWHRFRVKEAIAQKFNLSKFNQPLIKLDVDLFTFCLLISLVLFYLKLGQHTGNWLAYLYHLVSPFLIIIAFRLANKLDVNSIILLLAIIALNLFFIYPQPLFKGQDNYQQWQNLRVLISQHENVLNSPAIASILLEQDKKVYDSGQSEYFILGQKRKIFNIELPTDNKIKQRVKDYKQEIASSIQNQEFDLVVLTQRYSEFVSEDLVKKCYNYQGEVTVNMLAQSWKLDVWRPKESACN